MGLKPIGLTCLWLGLALLLAALPARAQALPEFTADYVLHKGNMKVAKSQVRLQRDGDRFIYSSVTKPAGLVALFRNDRIREQSVWTLQDTVIRPLEYRYEHQGSKKQRDDHLIFDWDANRVENTVEGRRWTVQVPDHALDKFSVQLAVMMDLREGPRVLEYAIADDGKVKHYRFDNLGVEYVDTPAGRFHTIKLVRADEDEGRQTYFWCAPDLDYLLVRVEHVDEDGSRFSMALDAVSGMQ